MKSNTALAKQIERLTMIVERMTPPIPAIPAIPSIPSIPAIAPLIPQNSGDHDLLTKLDTKVDQIQSDVSGLKKQNTNYVTQEDYNRHLKADEDHEARIRKMENVVSDVATIKKLVYGVVALILTLVATAVIYLVVIK